MTSTDAGADQRILDEDRGSGALDAFDPVRFVAAIRSVAKVLEDHAGGLDLLAGSAGTGDLGPGSDLSATVLAVVMAIDDLSDFVSVAAALPDAARRGATTVSGRRLAAILAGMAEVIRNADRLDGLRFALALEAGAERLASVDDGRHTGELPAVAAAVADGALAAADEGAALAEVLVSAADSGLEELEQGPLVEGRLAQRGVVDPTAAGFLLIIDSLASVVTGEPLPTAPAAARPGPIAGADAVATFEIRCLLEPHAGSDLETGDALAAELHEIADVRDLAIFGPRWRVDVQTRFPGAVVEALSETGRPTEVHIGVVDPAARDGSDAR